MTLKEIVEANNSKAVASFSRGGVIGCPALYPYLKRDDSIFTHCPYEGDEKCERCWGREE